MPPPWSSTRWNGPKWIPNKPPSTTCCSKATAWLFPIPSRAWLSATITCGRTKLLPITHSPPDADTVGLEIPLMVKQAIGLDEAPSWVIVSEHNIDEWPNGGLSSVPGKSGVFSHGFIPPSLFAQIRARFLEPSADPCPNNPSQLSGLAIEERRCPPLTV